MKGIAMCLTSPGLRCANHARQTFENATAKAKEAYIIMQNTKAQEQSKNTTANPKAVKAMEHYQKRLRLAEKAAHEYELTDESMEALKNRIADIKAHVMNPLLPSTHDDYEYTAENLLNLEAKYQSLKAEQAQRMQQYDRKHGTVNGRKPSAYGNREGIMELKEKHEKAFSDWTCAIVNGATAEEMKNLSARVQRRQKAYQHAVATYMHRRKGII